MAHNFTVARPYARAIFEDAKASQHLQHWLSVLQALAVITEIMQQQHLLDNPKVTHEQLEILCCEVAQQVLPEAVASIKQHLHNLIKILVQEKRLAVSKDIAVIYQQLLREYEDVAEIEVTSAYTLSEQQCQVINDALARRFAKNVKVNYSVDNALIGGAIIRAGNWVMDGSVKGSLNRLEDRLERTL